MHETVALADFAADHDFGALLPGVGQQSRHALRVPQVDDARKVGRFQLLLHGLAVGFLQDLAAFRHKRVLDLRVHVQVIGRDAGLAAIGVLAPH